MSVQPQKVVIVPCSGIGKTYGSVSREAAYEVVEGLCPGTTQLVPLSLLVLGDEVSRQAIAENPVITIDGCKLACATKMVQESSERSEPGRSGSRPGKQPARDFAVLEVYRRYKQFKPQGIAELSEGGLQLARALAQEIASEVERLGSESEAGQHG